ERRDTAPLLLLDDVLSELDAGRRRLLAGRISGRGQALVTATRADALPVAPHSVVTVEPGTPRGRRPRGALCAPPKPVPPPLRRGQALPPSLRAGRGNGRARSRLAARGRARDRRQRVACARRA